MQALLGHLGRARVRDDILYKRFLKRDGTGDHIQLSVPSALKRDVMCQMHDSLVSGHL